VAPQPQLSRLMLHSLRVTGLSNAGIHFFRTIGPVARGALANGKLVGLDGRGGRDQASSQRPTCPRNRTGRREKAISSIQPGPPVLRSFMREFLNSDALQCLTALPFRGNFNRPRPGMQRHEYSKNRQPLLHRSYLPTSDRRLQACRRSLLTRPCS
jgi:hypothetical protein